jgi:hypothetical protein
LSGFLELSHVRTTDGALNCGDYGLKWLGRDHGQTFYFDFFVSSSDTLLVQRFQNPNHIDWRPTSTTIVIPGRV